MDQNFIKFRDRLFDLYESAPSSEDGVEDLCICGESKVALLQNVYDILCLAQQLDVIAAIRLEIDEEYAEIDDVIPYLDGTYKFRQWQFNLSKLVLSKALKRNESDSAILFFFDQDVFRDWISGLDPIKSTKNIFVENYSVMIFLAGIHDAFGGPRLAVLPMNHSDSIADWWPCGDELPAEETLREHVHLVPSEPMRLSPRSFALTWGDFGCETARPLRKMSAVCVAAGFADVIYGQERIVLKGVRHLEIALFEKPEEIPDKAILELMQDALAWVYEERVDTRKGLLSDRLCLESDNESSFLCLLAEHLDGALKQSKDQYRFVILDRKDEYAKEVRGLLKDLRQQADLYAEKVRGLIGGLLRDTLAAFVFVALSLSSRLGSKIDVLLSDAGIIFFKALSVYFVVSASLQVTSALRDISLSDKELQQWSEITREYFSRKELNARINNDLRGRRFTFYIYIVLIAIAYSLMAGMSWNMQYFAEIFIGMSNKTS